MAGKLDRIELEHVFEGELYFNGVNGETGAYALPPLNSATLAQLIQGRADPATLPPALAALAGAPQPESADETAAEQERRGLLDLKRQARFPVKEGVDPLRLDQAGWAVVFPAAMDTQRREAIKAALAPLLKLRQEQAGPRYRVFEGGQGYRPGERLDQFFKHQTPEITKGPAEPDEMPFYVLLVGSPEEIPYEFQYQLDVMRGVGRLDFGDNLEAYARYAQSVVLAETGKVKLDRRMAFWGVATPGDKATQLSAQYLIQPLYENLQQPAPANEIPLKLEWQFQPFLGEKKATKAQLARLLGGDPAQTPALLMTASHGMEFSLSDPDRQRRCQGALLCQDWPGPGGGISPDHYFTAEDLGDKNLLGLMALFFACYGAGTPKMDQFARQAFKARAPIAPQSFVAALPQRMLSQGALAVIGHVERAWGYSFVTASGSLDNQAFITLLRKLLNGEPVGLATDPSFNLRYADMSSALSATLDELQWTPGYVSDYELAQLWTANNDARAYVVLGDPAARIPFAAAKEKPQARPSLGVVSVPTPQPKAKPKAAATPAPAAATTAPPSAAPAPQVEMSAVAFGLGDQFTELTGSLRKFTAQLATALSKVADEITTLEVETYTTADLAATAQAGAQATSQATLRAYTRITFDGDTKVFVPAQATGGVDRDLWEIHLATVKAAQENRAQLLSALAKLATDLLSTLKV